MLTIKPTTKFQKDVKRAQKRGYDMALLTEIIKQLAAGEPLPATLPDAVNAISRRTGCWCTRSRMRSSSSICCGQARTAICSDMP